MVSFAVMRYNVPVVMATIDESIIPADNGDSVKR